MANSDTFCFFENVVGLVVLEPVGAAPPFERLAGNCSHISIFSNTLPDIFLPVESSSKMETPVNPSRSQASQGEQDSQDTMVTPPNHISSATQYIRDWKLLVCKTPFFLKKKKKENYVAATSSENKRPTEKDKKPELDLFHGMSECTEDQIDVATIHIRIRADKLQRTRTWFSYVIESNDSKLIESLRHDLDMNNAGGNVGDNAKTSPCTSSSSSTTTSITKDFQESSETAWGKFLHCIGAHMNIQNREDKQIDNPADMMRTFHEIMHRPIPITSEIQNLQFAYRMGHQMGTFGGFQMGCNYSQQMQSRMQTPYANGDNGATETLRHATGH
ncbi:hypothetical protein RFI_01501, partial [Reticulomyxa filosa]